MIWFFERESPKISGNPPPMYSPSHFGIFLFFTGLKNFKFAPSRRNASKLS